MARWNRWTGLAALALCVMAQPALADIYTFKDDNGVIHFTNIPSSDKRYKLLRKEGDSPAAAAMRMPSARIMRPTVAGFAPSARRTPISWDRWETV